ncbi:hypothetical protein [Phycicoccus sp. Soil748]|uniref:hypothetical protein n=1 Tax=Phycicoccus sp. Soil748 TaxID=1736397 RepID=UPI001F3FE1F4|nr:hypothetical protein [Phycicoccus sp. Soil748]
MDPQVWGTVSALVASVLSAAALLVSATTLRMTRQDRLRAQVDLCATWVWRDDGGAWFVTFKNASALPMRDIRVSVLANGPASRGRVVRLSFARPGAEEVAPLGVALVDPVIDAYEVRDSRFRTWRCDNRNPAREVARNRIDS